MKLLYLLNNNYICVALMYFTQLLANIKETMKKIIYLLVVVTLVFIFNNAKGQSNDSLEMGKIIDEFVLKSHNNLSFQNGKNVFIDKPKNDTDALEKGFKLTHVDSEQNGGWTILATKDVQIEKQDYRAVLYAYNSKKYIVLYYEEENDKYYFRIFNSTYRL